MLISLYDFACLIIIFFIVYAIIYAKYGEVTDGENITF